MITLLRLVVLSSSLIIASTGIADDDDAAAMADGRQKSAVATALTRAGIKTASLQAVSQALEMSSYGTVVDLAPLFDMRQQYLATLAQHDGAQAKSRESALNLQRTQQLHAQDIVASRRLQEQQALWQADQASNKAVNYQQQSIIATSTLNWGERLTHWFAQRGDQDIKGFLHGKQHVLIVTLPSTTAPASIYIDPQGKRQQAVLARLIAYAPRVDPINQAQQAFYLLEGHSLPIGAQFTVWLADGSKTSQRVLVPESSLVWHLGQALVFVKDQNGQFERRQLADMLPATPGFIASSSLHADDEVVISGAQTLLSEELKSLIPSEDND